MSFIYLASPYTTSSDSVQESRYLLACSASAILATAKIAVYSPIVHWREVALQWRLPHDASMWWKQNRVMLHASMETWVYAMHGWERSKGIQQELEYTHSLNRIVRYFQDSKSLEGVIKQFKDEHPTLVGE